MQARPSLLFLPLLLLIAINMWATPDEPLKLTADERDLVVAFRKDPSAFRDLLGISRGRGAEEIRRSNAFAKGPGRRRTSAAEAALGPRDIVDLHVIDGFVAFWGKRRHFQPAAIRLIRGEERILTIRDTDPFGESVRVRVAYRLDGIHFDIPEPWGNNDTPRGCIVLSEDDAWLTDEAIITSGELNDATSESGAKDLVFRIRYVSSTR